MAFTAWEFIRGALLTWVVFLPLTIIPFLVMFAGGILHPDNIRGFVEDPDVLLGALSLWAFMLLPSATWGAAALVPAALVALAIGLALRRDARRSAHLLAHALWGFAVGIVVSGLVMGAWSFGGADLIGLLPTMLGYGIAVGLAAGLAWWATASLALRRDARTGVRNEGETGHVTA